MPDVAQILAALGLPQAARVDRRIPKRLLVQYGSPTPADTRQINDGIEEFHWQAILKPETVGIPASLAAPEIAVLSLHLRRDANPERLAELIHRAIPYLVVLLAGCSDSTTLSLAQKRPAQNDAEASVLDGPAAAAQITNDPLTLAWLPTMSLDRQPQGDLAAVYLGWIAALEALQAARITGAMPSAPPSPPPAAADIAARRLALDDHARLRREIARLRTAAAREKQMNRRVELNLRLKRLESEFAAVQALL